MKNLETVQRLYDAFATRDRETILEIFDPEIVWIQNEGFPGGGTHVGAESVLRDVFAPFRLHWESWEAVVSQWLDAGEAVVALGEYRGVYKATGKSMQSAFAHVYWIRDRRIVRFQQYTDTLMVARAMSRDPYVAESK
uniref:Ketosteroid isomerase-related protein-like protein n=1 Tax=Leptospirillum ferrodiazotrophum TaxID=412449 RepID=C6HVZ1_9BACT|nr:MAG: Ketosteroid isomerase-related protein-like protein [Leptospirillum ferrodiazotrophum]